MLTLPSSDTNNKNVQTFLDNLMGVSRSFDAPLNGKTIPPIKRYALNSDMDELAMRGIEVNPETVFPYFEDDIICDQNSRSLVATEGDFRSAAILTPFITIEGGSNYYYLSVWAWCNYQPVTEANRAPANQLFLGCIFYDESDNVLGTSTASGLNWTGKSGPVYYNSYSTKPGWNEYGINITNIAGESRLHTGTIKLRIYLSFIDYIGGVQEDGSDQRMAFANLGLWRMPFISALSGSQGTYNVDLDVGEEPMYCKVRSTTHNRLVLIRKIADRVYSVNPFIQPATTPASFYLKPTWSVESRLVQQVDGVMRTADQVQPMPLDFYENI